MFLTTPKFTFLDVKNCIAPGLSYDVWCKSIKYKLQNFMFPYEWLDIFEELSHVAPVGFKDVYCSFNTATVKYEDE